MSAPVCEGFNAFLALVRKPLLAGSKRQINVLMTETSKYSIIRKYNEIEIRQYPGYIQAEVTVDETNYN
jgi:hypothetical protein